VIVIGSRTGMRQGVSGETFFFHIERWPEWLHLPVSRHPR